MLWLLLTAAVSVSEATDPAAPVPPAPSPTPLCLDCPDIPPRVIRQTKPDYPLDALRAGVSGQVMIELTVTVAGVPENLRVLESVPMLDDAALDCVRYWAFEPARKDGQPVAAIVHAIVRFRHETSSGPSARGRASSPNPASGLALSFVVPPKRPKEPVGDLVRDLQHKKDRKRVEAAWKLSALPQAGPAAAAALAARLDDPSAEVRDHAAVALFGMNDPAGTLAAEAARPVVSHRTPAYPETLRETMPEGTVELLLLVSGSGRVLQARFVRKAAPEMDAAALAAASHWVFEPSTVRPRAFVAPATMFFKNGRVSVDVSEMP